MNCTMANTTIVRTSFCEGDPKRCQCGLAFCETHMAEHVNGVDEDDHMQDVSNFENLLKVLG